MYTRLVKARFLSKDAGEVIFILRSFNLIKGNNMLLKLNNVFNEEIFKTINVATSHTNFLVITNCIQT